MTRQLNVDTIVDKAGSGGTNVKIANTSVTVAEGGSATTTTVQGLAKAWVRGTVAAVRQDSFNTSGETDHGTGDFSYSLSSSFSAATYSFTATASSTDQRRNATENAARVTASLIAVVTSDAGTVDNTNHCITAHGDLA